MNLFESSAKPVLQSAISTMEERGSQYSDTLASCQWHITRAVATELGFIMTAAQARAFAIAGLCDIKYERFAGGYKMDHIEDGINYLACLPNMVEVAREGASNVVPFKDQLVSNEALAASKEEPDATFETVNDDFCGCYICRRAIPNDPEPESLIKWHQWSNLDVSGFVDHELVYSIKFDGKQEAKTGFGYTLSNMRAFCYDKYSFCLLKSAKAFAEGQEEKR